MNILTYASRFWSYLTAFICYKRQVSNYLGVSYDVVDNFYKEIIHSEFYREMENQFNLKGGFLNFSMLSVLRAPTFYVLIRIIKPEVVVETGVADGFSTVFILEAFRKNTKGNLYSIDLPNQPGQVLDVGKVTGWLVPEGLKQRWELILGSSQEQLLPLLKRLGKVDIFYHDSDHSYENMMFEFKTVSNYINQNGFIVADDITDNNAFEDFCSSIHGESLRIFKYGIMKK